MKVWRIEMQKTYEEILRLGPTYEEIGSFVEWLGNHTYGIVTFTKTDENPLSIRLHDTWRMKWGGRLHIDVVSGEFHLMLDRHNASAFLDFIKQKRVHTILGKELSERVDYDLLERIDYDLCVYGDATVESKKHRFMILKTLVRIPEDVREKILGNVVFIVATEGVRGTTFSFDLKYAFPETLFFIILNFGEMKDDSESEISGSIAHEIAHCLLGHSIMSGGRKAEMNADDLIEKWGFERAYKDHSKS